MKHTILVVGATGMLGEPVARQLLIDGYAVRVLTRSPEKARVKLGNSFDFVKGNVEDLFFIRKGSGWMLWGSH